ncbi:MAG TPA: inorganic pyrophosphatase [Vicinamibacteria bacterium]|jgi:inorganic pyrophosphatase
MALDPALQLLLKSHPWHGVVIGEDAPRRVTVFIEIVPSDTVKYELDKDSGLLKVDRPQLYSNVCPSPYGFVPRTLCAGQVAALAEERTGRSGLVGDDDPLDILVLTEKDFTHGNILVQAVPVGGLGMLDGNEVDDKIVAVMAKDAVYGGVDDIGRLPGLLVDRLTHYFLTYKQAPTGGEQACELLRVYGRDEAHEVIRRSQADYRERFASALGPLFEKG